MDIKSISKSTVLYFFPLGLLFRYFLPKSTNKVPIKYQKGTESPVLLRYPGTGFPVLFADVPKRYRQEKYLFGTQRVPFGTFSSKVPKRYLSQRYYFGTLAKKVPEKHPAREALVY
jgi:hypothetical protein